MLINRVYPLLMVLMVFCLVQAGCSGGAALNGADALPGQAVQPPDIASPQTAWPAGLPVDALQPWEEPDGNGMAQSAAGGREASALGADSEFLTGIERFSEGGSAADNGEATNLSSVAGGLSYAVYRMPLGGGEPGVVSVDANLLDGNGYYVGLADYAADAWDWHGPFADNHVRLSVAGPGATADLTSALGSTFVCVVAHDGAACDVVGIGIDVADGADSEAPPAPASPLVTPVAGGLQLDWPPVAAGDLAGYRVYHSSQWFLDGQGTGVRVEDSLEGLMRFLLASYSETTFARLSAVDISGNESPLSEFVSGAAAAGTLLDMHVEVSAPSAALGEPVAITATGAETYDFDTDGDGIYDITGDTTGIASVDTTSLGILRPRVRASSGDGSLVALGGASVVIAGNSRPVASAAAVPSTGIAPLDVTFTGGESTDFDGEIVGGGWDFDGDGTYDVWDDADIVHVTSAAHSYMAPGIYNAKLRVVDNDGAWDVDTVAVLVTPDPDPANTPPSAMLTAYRTKTYAPFTVRFDASGSTDGDGTVLLYEWDFNGDGAYEATGPSSSAVHTYPVRGMYNAGVRVTDNLGASDTAQLAVTLPTEWPGYNRNFGFTGQSPYVGAQTNEVKWTYPVGDNIFSSPAIGVDGTVYFGSTANSLYAINPAGGLKWSYSTTASITSAPVVGDDGTIFFGDYDGKLYAVKPNGSARWSRSLPDFIFGGPCIAPDGTLYVGCWDGLLYSFFADGSDNWTYNLGSQSMACPVIDADGTVYASSRFSGFHAINRDGSLKWSDTTVGQMRSSPAVSPAGFIYIGDDSSFFYKYDRDGNRLWDLPTAGSVFGAPSFAADGTVYFCCQSATDSLYSVTPEGEVNWTFPTGGIASCAPAIGADGVVYFGCFDGFVYAVNPDGTELWSYDTGSSWVESSGAIAADGTVYFGDESGNLIAFGPTV